MAVRLGAGAQAEAQRTLLRSLELLASQGPESEDALLTMLQKAKKEADSARPSVPSSSAGISKPTSQVQPEMLAPAGHSPGPLIASL